MFIGKGVPSTLMALGSIPSMDEKCNYDYPRKGSSHEGPDEVQAAECAGGLGKLRLLLYTDTIYSETAVSVGLGTVMAPATSKEQRSCGEAELSSSWVPWKQSRRRRRRRIKIHH